MPYACPPRAPARWVRSAAGRGGKFTTVDASACGQQLLEMIDLIKHTMGDMVDSKALKQKERHGHWLLH